MLGRGLNDNQHQTERGRAARFSIPGAQTLGPQRPAPDEGGGGWRGVSKREAPGGPSGYRAEPCAGPLWPSPPLSGALNICSSSKFVLEASP